MLELRSPARAFAWQFLRRHRWGFVAIAAYLAILVTVRHSIIPDSESFAFTVLVPSTFSALYLLAVFTFGFSGDLAVRESLYPARFFTLPVPTASLVNWPMLYGVVAIAALTLASILFGFRAVGVPAALIWPPLFGAVFLAWAQALTWMPYPWRGTRTLLAAAWLVIVDTIVLVALNNNVRESIMVAFLAPQLPLAYATARYAVAMARRGHVPEFGLNLALAHKSKSALRPRRHFRTVAQAQTWLEWREHGIALPQLVAIVLPFELALLFIFEPKFEAIMLVIELVLLTPPFMALLSAANQRVGNGEYGLSPFLATRPTTSAAMIAAKLQVAVWSTLVTWLMVLIATPLVLLASGTWRTTADHVRAFAAYVGTTRATVALLLLLLILIATTWRMLVQSLCIKLTGRAWLIKGSVFTVLMLMVAIVPVGEWLVARNDVEAALWRDLRWILATLVLLKLSAATWTATRLWRTRVVSDRSLIRGAAIWLTSVLLLHAVLVWWLSTPHFPAYFLAMIAILMVPLARVAAAPLALAWNRHQ